ncbi:DUF1176 domain-containing protein [Massilia sp. CCM 8695]|uniref:DUF1176 domain-containing protein n=1 Tax=Massilia frigida TaxID=2609281 RepID=A0ABX0N664_9BURK|nr:DUF1176 domain-containing protein [Massilia frigida]NHZ77811.1 DUF1176 domain-containing protein [Massilia frigida]
MKALHRIGLLLALAGGSANATDFTYGDWAVACDNTRRCEAVGYQRDGEEPAALYLRREAGPGQPVQLTLMLDTGRGNVPDQVTLTVGQVAVRDVVPEQEIDEEQAAGLIAALLKGERAEIEAGSRRWSVSLNGASAALLKMDDLQGRVGTPGALVRKGTKKEASVLPALPVPLLRAVPPARARPGDRRLLAAISKSIAKRACGGLSGDKDEDEREKERSLSRLSGNKVLLLIACGHGSYQSSSEAWIANDKPPFAAEPAILPLAGKHNDNSVVNAYFDKGELSSHEKWRATNECGSSMKWLWTGKGFALLSWETAAQCRGFPEGIALRKWIAERASK